MGRRGPQDSIRIYAAIITPDELWVSSSGLGKKTASDVKSVLLEDVKLFNRWADPLKDACEDETNDDPGGVTNIKPTYFGHRWRHQTGATLLGDAVHLMTPWAGEGVNMTLRDSLDLFQEIISVPVTETTDAASWQADVDPLIRH